MVVVAVVVIVVVRELVHQVFEVDIRLTGRGLAHADATTTRGMIVVVVAVVVPAGPNVEGFVTSATAYSIFPGRPY